MKSAKLLRSVFKAEKATIQLPMSARNFRRRLQRSILIMGLLVLVVNSLEALCTVSCRSSMNISLGVDGTATISPSLLLQDNSCDPADFTVSIRLPNGSWIDDTIDCQQIGQTVTARVRRISDGNYCETQITVADNLPPMLSCRDTFLACSKNEDPAISGYPDYSDNCTPFAFLQISYSDTETELACYTEVMGDSVTTLITRVWTVSDLSGNANSCTQLIYFRRGTLDDIEFPAHRDDLNLPALNCGQDPDDLSLSGFPMIDSSEIKPNGFCELAVSYSDQIFDECLPTSYRVLRTWTAIDWCSGDFRLNAQIIKVMDKTAPVLSMPNDLTLSTQIDDCTAVIMLPSANATDDCSGVTIVPSWEFGSGYGPFYNVPLGVHFITYRATDDCGNFSEEFLRVVIADQVPPVVVCDFETHISLSNDGMATVPASVFDNGTYDNCQLDYLEVSRDGINFAPFVTFHCADIDSSPISVTLRAFDVAGNFNECHVTAVLEENTPPVIQCPSTRFLECTQDIDDLTLTGQPSVYDNCGIDTVFYVDQKNLNTCNVGSVVRTWKIYDIYGNYNQCTQFIYLQDSTPLEVYFPEDVTLTDCSVSTHPDFLGKPTFENNDCEDVYVSHTDQIFPLSGAACYRIVRHWTVVDWCIYQPNSGSNDGLWEDSQLIIVHDNVAPELSCPSDTLFNNYADNCGSIYIALPPATAFDCSPNLAITNNSPFADASGADASGHYPPGNYLITFTAEDGCGNVSTCSSSLIVKDAKPPTPYCRDGVVVSMPSEGVVYIYPELFNLGSSDNCTADEDLIMTVFPDHFTCDEIGEQLIELIVRDEAGNTASCFSTVQIQDNEGNCPSADIEGHVFKENGEAIKNVKINLSGGATLLDSTDSGGQFIFEQLQLDNPYTIRPQKNDEPRNGISSYDLLLISRHILGVTPLDSPYKRIAADVNQSGTISTFDLVELRKLILYISDEFRDNSSWRFIQAAYVFADPLNPFASSFPEIYSIENLQADFSNADFIGIKTGDINLNADPQGLINGHRTNMRSNGPYYLESGDEKLNAGSSVVKPFYLNAEKDFVGGQFQLDWNTDLLSIRKINLSQEAVALGLDESNFNLDTEKGILRFSWDNESQTINEKFNLFNLEISAIETIELSEAINISPSGLASEIYSDDLLIHDLPLRWEQPISPGPKILQNYPNPFSTITYVPLQIDESGTYELLIYNAAGQIIYAQQESLEKGEVIKEIHRHQLKNCTNVIYFQLRSENYQSPLVKSLCVDP